MRHFKLIAFVVFTFLLSLNTFAQDSQTSARFEKIERQKIAFITKNLNVSSAEAKRFFPIYQQYSKDFRALRAAKSNLKAKSTSDFIEYDAKEVELKKQYRAKFSEVIGISRASQFFVLEQEFKEMLFKEWHNRHN